MLTIEEVQAALKLRREAVEPPRERETPINEDTWLCEQARRGRFSPIDEAYRRLGLIAASL